MADGAKKSLDNINLELEETDYSEDLPVATEAGVDAEKNGDAEDDDDFDPNDLECVDEDDDDDHRCEKKTNERKREADRDRNDHGRDERNGHSRVDRHRHSYSSTSHSYSRKSDHDRKDRRDKDKDRNRAARIRSPSPIRHNDRDRKRMRRESYSDRDRERRERDRQRMRDSIKEEERCRKERSLAKSNQSQEEIPFDDLEEVDCCDEEEECVASDDGSEQVGNVARPDGAVDPETTVCSERKRDDDDDPLDEDDKEKTTTCPWMALLQAPSSSNINISQDDEDEALLGEDDEDFPSLCEEIDVDAVRRAAVDPNPPREKVTLSSKEPSSSIEKSTQGQRRTPLASTSKRSWKDHGVERRHETEPDGGRRGVGRHDDDEQRQRHRPMTIHHHTLTERRSERERREKHHGKRRSPRPSSRSRVTSGQWDDRKRRSSADSRHLHGRENERKKVVNTAQKDGQAEDNNSSVTIAANGPLAVGWYSDDTTLTSAFNVKDITPSIVSSRQSSSPKQKSDEGEKHRSDRISMLKRAVRIRKHPHKENRSARYREERGSHRRSPVKKNITKNADATKESHTRTEENSMCHREDSKNSLLSIERKSPQKKEEIDQTFKTISKPPASPVPYWTSPERTRKERITAPLRDTPPTIQSPIHERITIPAAAASTAKSSKSENCVSDRLVLTPKMQMPFAKYQTPSSNLLLNDNNRQSLIISRVELPAHHLSAQPSTSQSSELFVISETVPRHSHSRIVYDADEDSSSTHDIPPVRNVTSRRGALLKPKKRNAHLIGKQTSNLPDKKTLREYVVHIDSADVHEDDDVYVATPKPRCMLINVSVQSSCLLSIWLW